jgi:hypothetical protein
LTSPASDPAQPAAARIYDYLLGGKDNCAVDRAAAEKVLAVAPDQRRLARANRAFAIRAVRVLAEAGIKQFIDLGTGFPTSPSVHEAARQADPSARVVYVDHDPVVHAHNTALLATADRVASVQADIRRPEDIFGHPDVARLIDLGEPVVLLCVTVRILRFFDGFELLAPGLTDVQGWRQDSGAPTRLRIAGGVGRKP